MKDTLRAQGMLYLTYLCITLSDEKLGEFWRTTNTTWGNNVFAHENWDGRNSWINNHRPEGMTVSGKYWYAGSLIFIFVNDAC